MKTILTLLAAFFPFLNLQASITVELDAGRLQTASAGVDLQNGALIQIIATRAGATGTFAAPTSGSYTGGDNLVVASFAMNYNFGTGETDNTFTFTLENTSGLSSAFQFDQGDALLLRWYPTITYSDFLLGTKPQASDPYGQYRSDSGQAGGIAWLTPADGSSLFVPGGLNLNTEAVGGSTSYPDSLGVANLVVVPEPSTWALVVCGILVVLLLHHRKAARLS